MPRVSRQIGCGGGAFWCSSRLRLGIVICAVVLVVVPTDAATASGPSGTQPSTETPETYFVSCTGNDQNDGTSAATPWASLGKIDGYHFAPGTHILLERGCVWHGSLVAGNSGTGGLPIVVSAYGSGDLPGIVGEDAPAVALRNFSNWTVEDLDLTQIGQRAEPLDRGNVTGKDRDAGADRFMKAVVDIRALGPHGEQNCGAACRVGNITLDHLVVHDGQWDGIYVGAGYQEATDGVYGSIDGLTIEDVEVRDNQSGGIVVAGTFTKQIRYEVTNVEVLDSLVYGNGGNGIVLGQVDHGLIEENRCAYNGSIRNASMGCWSWDSKDIVIQFNEADHNMTPLDGTRASDGGGFDLDMGSVDSVMQYNWSHDDQGEGFLFESWPIGFGYQCCVSRNVTMRYNVSEDDGTKDGGSIEIFGGVRSAWVYNNTVSFVAPRTGRSVLRTEGDLTTTSFDGRAGRPDLHVENNIFVSDGASVGTDDGPLVTSDGQGTFRFDHNLWFFNQGGVLFDWDEARITNWAGWTALGFDPHGENADPLLTGPTRSEPTGDELQAGSPAISVGADLRQSPLGMGRRDYFGSPVPQGTRYDAGAAEFPDPESSSRSDATPVSHQVVEPSSHVASLEIGCSASAGAVVVRRGAVVHWCVRLTDAHGAPATGERVTTTIYSPSWDSITGTVSTATGISGAARFSFRTLGTMREGAYFLSISQVVPPSTTYYDSYRNVATTGGFTLK